MGVRMGIQEADPDADRMSWAARAAVVLSYAHWEGFVKESSARYVKLINSRKIRVDLLKVSLQAACLQSHFKRAQGSGKMGYLGSILSEMDGRRCEVFNALPEKIIDAESNLSSTVFRELISSLGLDYLDAYETRQAFVDERLVRSRNQVAHGELVAFTVTEAVERIDGVLVLLDLYSDQLIDAARDSRFLLSENFS
jgi:RiboL-PSP-HEPN